MGFRETPVYPLTPRAVGIIYGHMQQSNVTPSDKLARAARRLGRELDENERALLEGAMPTDGLAMKDRWGGVKTFRELLADDPPRRA